MSRPVPSTSVSEFRRPRSERIETVAELPYQLHVDHPEGLELWPEAGDGSLLIIYDAPAPERTDSDTLTVRVDVISPRQGEDGRS